LELWALIAIFLLIAGLGMALGLAFRVSILVLVSAVTLVGVFVLGLTDGRGVPAAALDSLLGVAVLQLGYFVSGLGRSLAVGFSRRDVDGVSDESAGATNGLIDSAADGSVRSESGLGGPQTPVAGAALDARLEDLFRRAPGFMAVFRGPEHVVESINEAYRDLVGARPIVGRPIRDALPEVAGQGFFDLLDRVYAGGRAEKRSRTPVLLQRNPDGPPDKRIIDFVCEPIRDASGRVFGIFVEGHDVTEAAAIDERLRETERLAHSTIDALTEHIAVLEADGTVATVNKAWRDFAAAHGSSLPASSEGENYLAVCDRAAGEGDQDAAKVAALIRNVISGKARQGQWEYARDGLADQRWFSLMITRFGDDGPVRVVLAHEDITRRKLSESRIEYLATHDALTGLPNRNLLEDRMQQSIEHAQRAGLGLAVLSLDLDDFRHFNDAYGHVTGDAVISVISQRVAKHGRPGDTVARLGSDEFTIVLNDLDDVSTDAARMAHAILAEVSAPLRLGEHEFTLPASIGISLYPADGATFDALLKNAEAAMYRAKTLGRGGYQFYSPEMSARANERVIIEGELRRALRRDQFELHFQPQVAIETGDLIGVEALVRWKHPELGWLQPARFIPIAEETGLIGPLGRYVLREACLQSRAWKDQGIPPVPVAVNIAAAQLRHADFVVMVRDIVEETGIDPKTLELEITEGTMMEVTEPLLARIDSLKQLGVRLSIDDFGTGYSNLAYLRTFPLDRLKIDQSFIASAPHDEGSQSIVRAILGLGESLGLDVVAEGVETAEQAALLEKLGCRKAQGYLYGKPMPAEALVTWVNARKVAGAHPTVGQMKRG
jgi:diguanylate cyclase (GGDEF)-like protein